MIKSTIPSQLQWTHLSFIYFLVFLNTQTNSPSEIFHKNFCLLYFWWVYFWANHWAKWNLQSGIINFISKKQGRKGHEDKRVNHHFTPKGYRVGHFSHWKIEITFFIPEKCDQFGHSTTSFKFLKRTKLITFLWWIRVSLVRFQFSLLSHR